MCGSLATLVLLSALASSLGYTRKGGMSDPVVQTRLGKLRGSLLETWTGKPVLGFRGVRYAKPPLANLRFMPPVPLEPWNGIADATKDGSICPQPGGDYFGPSSEDCLILNVYTKQLDGNKPVIVFIHPGGFFSATSRSDWSGPDYLLDQDIVLVTVHYRLGPLGFLSTGDGQVVGNAGMKDQVLALRWVRDNIANFGGDPNSVTIAGYSAGSTSVMLHMLSPMSKGLFHRGIAMSAGATSNWVVNENPLELAKRLAGIVGCPVSVSSKELVDCLRKVPADVISDEAYKKLPDLQRQTYYALVVEPDRGDGAERFLTDHPKNIIMSKNFAHVPLVVGIIENEFDFLLRRTLQNETWLNILNTDFETIAPIYFVYESGTEKSKQFSRKLRHFYLGDKPVTKEDFRKVGMISSDAFVIVGQEESAKLFAKYSRAPVYFYMTTYVGRFSNEVDEKTKKPLGAAHHDELIYLFYNAKQFPDRFSTTDPEAKTVRRLTTLFSNFAEKGDPTPSGVSVKWAPMRLDNLQYMEIGEELTMKKGLPYPERMALWEMIYPKIE
uniref:Carboxylic ester hydrolase n=1 Tax=Lethocerus distinctifemur TaxID=280095 RepID=A0A2K8JL68_9HEMI|nr:venom carboxylesterase [Lethocerus distinctifemur]